MCPLEIIGWIIVGVWSVGVLVTFAAAVLCVVTDVDNYDDWKRKQRVKHGCV